MIVHHYNAVLNVLRYRTFRHFKNFCVHLGAHAHAFKNFHPGQGMGMGMGTEMDATKTRIIGEFTPESASIDLSCEIKYLVPAEVPGPEDLEDFGFDVQAPYTNGAYGGNGVRQPAITSPARRMF